MSLAATRRNWRSAPPASIRPSVKPPAPENRSANVYVGSRRRALFRATGMPRCGLASLQVFLPRLIPVGALALRAYRRLIALLTWNPFVRAPFAPIPGQHDLSHRVVFYHKHATYAISLIGIPSRDILLTHIP